MLKALLRTVLGSVALGLGGIFLIGSLVAGLQALLKDGDAAGAWVGSAVAGGISLWLIASGRRMVREPRGRAAPPPVKSRPALAALLAVMAVVIAVGASTVLPESKAKSRARRPPSRMPATAVVSPAAGAPAVISPTMTVDTLRGLGHTDGLGGRGWHRSDFDGRWCAIFRRTHGVNEVSCLLESDVGDRVQRVVLEAEFHEPAPHAQVLLEELAAAVEGVYDRTTPELLAAIARQQAWSEGSATLLVDGDPGGSHVLRFTWMP